MNSVRNTPNGSILTDEEYNTIVDSLYPVLRVLGPIIVDDTNYYDDIDYDTFYTNKVEDYLLTDEEMGRKYGLEDGKSYGYDDGLYDNPKNENPVEVFGNYGPVYDEAYINNYINAYLEYYELGRIHKDDLTARGKYDGGKYAYSYGYYDGSHGKESVPYEDFYKEDWMTEEYINAYNEAYKEEYLKGYKEGLKNPASSEETIELEQKELYHFASLFRNISNIIKMHHPQENLKLIHSYDSYYSQSEIIEGDNQTFTLGDTNDITIICSGALTDLITIKVNGVVLDESYRELASGSTILTLKNSYLNTLSKGTYTITFEYETNSKNATLNVIEIANNDDDNTNDDINDNINTINTNNPQTSYNVVEYVFIFIIGIICLASGTVYLKRNNLFRNK